MIEMTSKKRDLKQQLGLQPRNMWIFATKRMAKMRTYAMQICIQITKELGNCSRTTGKEPMKMLITKGINVAKILFKKGDLKAMTPQQILNRQLLRWWLFNLRNPSQTQKYDYFFGLSPNFEIRKPPFIKVYHGLPHKSAIFLLPPRPVGSLRRIPGSKFQSLLNHVL